MKVEQLHSSLLVRNLKIFEKLKMQVVKSPTDVTGVETKICKEHEQTEIIIIKEKFEQDVINKLVFIDFKKRITTAVLLFKFNPMGKLAHNKCKAVHVYNQ